MNPKTEISVVVPLYNEGPNLLAFFEELDGAMTTFGKSYEIIFVNDGSIDNSEKILTDIVKQNKHTQVINLRKNAGKPGALEQGFELANGNKIVILDADLQYDPKDIQFLVDKIDEGYDVVSGKRVNRADSKSVVLSSKLFRLVVKKLSGLDFTDYFSGLKCFKSSVISYLGVYGDLNRIFSVYAHRAGFEVCEIPITHRPRGEGKSRYTFLDRFKLAIGDIAVLFFTVTIRKEKLYKFGFFGLLILSFGWLMLVVSLLRSPDLSLNTLFESTLTRIGVLVVYIGWQLRVFETVGKEFIERWGKEFALRSRNVKDTHNVTKFK